MERIGDAVVRLRLHEFQRKFPPQSAEEVVPSCSLCKDHGFVRKDVPLDDPEFGRAIPCVCRRDELQDRLRRRSNLGPLGNRTFDSFDPDGREPLNEPARQRLRAAFENSRTWANAPIGWLVLYGPPACGKTHLAAAIANRQLELGHDAFFAVVPDLLDHLRATYGPNSDVSYDELFESVRCAQLLILDDLGTQNASPWAQEKLFQLLNHRFNAALPTVITTNHRLGELDARLRARIEDRTVAQVLHLREWESPIVEALLGDWPAGLRAQRFENFEHQASPSLDRAHEAAWTFANQPTGWLVLVGEVGRGKTHLAAAIKNHRDEQGEATLFMTVPDLLDYLRATYAPSSDITYDRGFDAIRNAPLLILDDYGAHSSTPWAEEKLFQLLNYRFNARLPTVITTNVPFDRPEALEPGAQQELRILSRILDRALSTIRRLDAPPYGGRPTLSLRPPRQRSAAPRQGRNPA